MSSSGPLLLPDDSLTTCTCGHTHSHTHTYIHILLVPHSAQMVTTDMQTTLFGSVWVHLMLSWSPGQGNAAAPEHPLEPSPLQIRQSLLSWACAKGPCRIRQSVQLSYTAVVRPCKCLRWHQGGAKFKQSLSRDWEGERKGALAMAQSTQVSPSQGKGGSEVLL